MTTDEVGTVFRVEEGYEVHFDPEDYLILKAGSKTDQPGSKFVHRNVVASCGRVFEFKHEARSGQKRWTTSCGVEFHLVVPKSRIELLHEKGYSYVPVIIGGLRTILNVSGGSDGQGGWCDWVRRIADTQVGFPLRSLALLADQALTPEECRARGITFDLRLREIDQKRYTALATYARVRNLIQPGHKIVLASGWDCSGSEGPFPVVSRPRNKRHFLCDYGWGKVQVKYEAVDWVVTATLNGLAVEQPFAWNKIGNVLSDE